MKTNVPKIGEIVKVYNVDCKVTKVYPFGTMDVLSLDNKRVYRVTGLAWINKNGEY